MKKTLYIALILIIALSACRSTRNTLATPTATDSYTEQPEVTYQTFYDKLSPYGRWIDFPGMGYAWVPGEIGFRPYYSNGHWAYTNEGWAWVSNYQWGWAAFHYGRWINDPFYGWTWLPGYQWAPAWVNWRSNADMYGWEPMGPGTGFSNYNNNSYNHWTFVPCQYINSGNVYNYYQAGNQTFINNTTIINNTNIVNNNYSTNQKGAASPKSSAYNGTVKNTYPAGPDVRDVERVTKTTIKPLAIEGSNAPQKELVTGNNLKIYRPLIKSEQVNTAKAASVKPANVMPYKKIPAIENNPAINNPQQQIKNNEPGETNTSVPVINQADPKPSQPDIDNNKMPQRQNGEIKIPMPIVKQADPKPSQPDIDNNKMPQRQNGEIKIPTPIVKQADPKPSQPDIDNNKMPQRQNGEIKIPTPIVNQADPKPSQPVIDNNKMPQQLKNNPVLKYQQNNPPKTIQTPVKRQPEKPLNPPMDRKSNMPSGYKQVAPGIRRQQKPVSPKQNNNVRIDIKNGNSNAPKVSNKPIE